MVKQFKFGFLLISFVLMGYVLHAQKFYASSNKSQLGVNQRFQVTFTAEGKATNFKPPSFDNFQILFGPNPMHSSQIINGQYSQSLSYTYILTPIKAGKFSIREASIKIGGKKFTSKPIKITVVTKAQNTKQNTSNQTNSKSNSYKTLEKNIKENLFVKAYISKSNPYQGEQIILTYKFFNRVGFYDSKFTSPKLTGFWAENVELKNKSISVEIIEGKKFNVRTFQKKILFPQKSGKIIIEPLKIEGNVRVQSNTRSRSPFDDFFNDPFSSYQNYRTALSSNSITINVKKLPQKPLNFSGLVGNFSFNVETDKTETTSNDPITFKIDITGRGNIKLVNDFDLDLPSDIETYEPKTKEKISITKNGVSGTKSFEYLLIPRVAGEYRIPALDFIYFDPVKNQYITKSSDEIPIKISKGDGEEYVVVHGGASQKEIELRGKDIQFIRMNLGKIQDKDKYFFGSLFHIILLLTPFVLFIIVILVRKRIMELRSDVVLTKKRKATSFARKRLKEANKHLKNNSSNEFYSSIINALTGYISDKLNISVSQLTKEIIEEKLIASDISQNMIEEFKKILGNCEFARYAPSQVDFLMTDIYNQAVEIISNIEKQLK